MNIKPIFLAAACAALLSLTACGGGGDSAPAVAGASPASLVVTDSLVGTGDTAVAGKKLTVNYTGWLYSDTAVDHKGLQFDKGTIPFTLGQGSVIRGWDQGLVGMKAGGRRQLVIPPSLGYGDQAQGEDIPANSTLIFVVDLVKIG